MPYTGQLFAKMKVVNVTNHVHFIFIVSETYSIHLAHELRVHIMMWSEAHSSHCCPSRVLPSVKLLFTIHFKKYVEYIDKKTKSKE